MPLTNDKTNTLSLPYDPFDIECCGQHAVCEEGRKTAKDRLIIEYYDDEELDAYSGVTPDLYDKKAVDEFSEVLYTMQANDVAGWLYSLQQRNIRLPEQLQDEAFLIIQELHNNR